LLARFTFFENFGESFRLGHNECKMARNLILLMAILAAPIFAGIFSAHAGVDSEVTLGVPLLAVTSEAKYWRLVAAGKNHHPMLRMMLEDDTTVVIPKATTVIVDHPNDEATKDETEGMARIHVKGSKTPFWTTNYMIKQARYFAQ
jgi:hypothetical protein